MQSSNYVAHSNNNSCLHFTKQLTSAEQDPFELIMIINSYFQDNKNTSWLLRQKLVYYMRMITTFMYMEGKVKCA